MSYNYTLQYRTFDELVADASSDFKKYQLSGIIDPQELVKVAQRVNYDLGLRIYQTREVVLEVEKNKVRLPNDFYILNFAFVCNKYKVKSYVPQGTHIEERPIGQIAPEYQEAPPEEVDFCTDITVPEEPCDPCDPCAQCNQPCCGDVCNACCTNPESCSLTCKGEVMQVVQVLKTETRYYEYMVPLKIALNPKAIDKDCPNLRWESELSAYIKDGWLFTNFETGKIYLNYQGMMEDDHGNLLVPDHPKLNEYYEYALKQRILENLIMNDEVVNPQKIQLVEQRYRHAKSDAHSIVNTPNFEELRQVYQMNRKAMYNKYYSMFRSYGGPLDRFSRY
jgi:hypothetical protein